MVFIFPQLSLLCRVHAAAVAFTNPSALYRCATQKERKDKTFHRQRTDKAGVIILTRNGLKEAFYDIKLPVKQP